MTRHLGQSVRVLQAMEQATAADAPLVIFTGVLFLAIAGWSYRTGWTGPAMASRLRRGDDPQRSGFNYWSTCIGFAVFGVAAVIGGIGLLF